MPRERRRVTYSGRVQGVGFRFTAERLAHEHGVSGWVRNLDDGRVELVVEGGPDELDALVEAIGRAMQGKIRSAETTIVPLDDEHLSDFSIRY